MSDRTSYRFTGSGVDAFAGFRVSSAGDIDGDGQDDLIIAAPGTSDGGTEAGAVYLVTSAALSAADGADGTADGVIDLDNISAQSGSYELIGVDAGDQAGISIASAGDIDGDGLDDVIIGANGADGGGEFSGESYLISSASLAAADGADGTTDGVINLDNVNEQTGSYQFIGTETGDLAGLSISSAGDVDGDGTSDLLIGAPTADGDSLNSGETYLITSSSLVAADGADGTTDGVIDLDNINEQTGSYQFNGTEFLDVSGLSVSSAGDVDGDGMDDVIIGARDANGGGASSGEAYLITASALASADAADGTTDGIIDLDNVNEQTGSYQFIGTEAGDEASVSVASAGDVDGDGMDDLIIGASRADGGGENSGEAYLITAASLAAADGADGTTDGVIDLDNVNEQTGSYQFIGTEASDQAGISVASAGDVDGDGLDDLLIGADLADGGGDDSGEVYLIAGASLAAADAADGTTDGIIDLDNINEQIGSYQFIGANAEDHAGISVSSAGDVNADGLDDLLIGAQLADDGGSNSGEAYLVSGSDLAFIDALDGEIDGVILLDNISIEERDVFVGGSSVSGTDGVRDTFILENIPAYGTISNFTQNEDIIDFRNLPDVSFDDLAFSPDVNGNTFIGFTRFDTFIGIFFDENVPSFSESDFLF